MGKYVTLMTDRDLKAESDKDPKFAKFLADNNLNNSTIGASVEVKLPDAIDAWFDKNDPDSRKLAQEAYIHMLSCCVPMLMDRVPDMVRKRMRPVEVLELLADEVVEAVYAPVFGYAGVEINPEYIKLSHLTVALGKADAGILQAFVCANAHRKATKIAEGREDLPDIDPALAAKATHRGHAAIN